DLGAEADLEPAPDPAAQAERDARDAGGAEEVLLHAGREVLVLRGGDAGTDGEPGPDALLRADQRVDHAERDEVGVRDEAGAGEAVVAEVGADAEAGRAGER